MNARDELLQLVNGYQVSQPCTSLRRSALPTG
jgi:hypothetical protein